MAARLIRKSDGKIVVEVEIDLGASATMLDKEMAIRAAINEAGAIGTAEALKAFDIDGSPIISDGRKYTSKGEHGEKYECPYGSIIVSRHVYQSSAGGRTFCPLESNARLILNSTPAFAKMISGKYARGAARDAARDMLESNGRQVCSVYIKKVSDFIGEVAEIKENEWQYDLPARDEDVTAVAVGIDGTCMLLCETGWREAMTGTISLYNGQGERLHTIYSGAFPEYGKAKFLSRFDAELNKVKAAFPDCAYIGLADGAPDNWSFLTPRTNRHVLDFYHASEYVAGAASIFFPRSRTASDAWLEDRLHRLKNEHGFAKKLLNEFCSEAEKLPVKKRGELQKVITYFQNHYKQMNYARQIKDGMPIGSGVTEAACKELIKQRLCNSGMRWKEGGASAVIAIRSLVLTGDRWQQFWNKISNSGCPCHKKFTRI
jgi:hypothetical protein